MPAQSGDSVSSALHHSLSSSRCLKGGSSQHLKLIASSKQILQSEVKYESTCSFNTSHLDDLKSKYTILSTVTTETNSNSCSSSSIYETGSLNNGKSSSNGENEPTNSNEPSVPIPRRVLYSPESVVVGWKSNLPVGSGFSNLGNTCYLNSTLQALFHVPAFVNWLMSDTAHFTKCQTMNGFTHSECLICAMSKTLKDSHGSTGSAVKPLSIYSKLKAICKHLVHGHQEDAHEFLRYLIEGMERSYLMVINGAKLDSISKETTPLNQIFGGYLRTEVTCLECRYVSTTFQHFQDLLLDIRTASTVEDALDGYFARERLGDGDQAYRCEQCKRKVAAAKKFSLERPPKALCIQLKRFGAMGGKNNKHIALKQMLDMTKYRHRPQIGMQFRYKLVALVTHLGHSSSCGHYTAVGQAPSGSYYLFDDSDVRPLSLQNVLNTNAYILMYELDPSSGPGTSANNSGKLVQKQNYIANTSSNGTINNGTSVNGASVSNSGEKKTTSELKSSSEQIPMKVDVTQKSASTSSLFQPHPLPKQVSSSPSPNSSYASPKPLNSSSPKLSRPTCAVPLTSQQPQSSKSSDAPVLVPYISGTSSDSEEGEINSMSCSSSGASSSTSNNTSSSTAPKTNRLSSTSTSESSSKNDSSFVEVASTAAGKWAITECEKDDSDKKLNSKNYSPNSAEHRNGTTSKATMDTLSKMSHRGYCNPVNSWNGGKSEMDKEIEKERLMLKRPHSSNFDDEMDRGKVKKVKKYQQNHQKDRRNRFQDFQNRRNHWSNSGGSGHGNSSGHNSRQTFYRQYTYERSKGHNNNSGHFTSRWN